MREMMDVDITLKGPLAVDTLPFIVMTNFECIQDGFIYNINICFIYIIDFASHF